MNQIYTYFFCKLMLKTEALNVKCPSRHPSLQENQRGFSVHQTQEKSYRLDLYGYASQALRTAEKSSQTLPRLFMQAALWEQPRKLVSGAVFERVTQLGSPA